MAIDVHTRPKLQKKAVCLFEHKMLNEQQYYCGEAGNPRTHFHASAIGLPGKYFCECQMKFIREVFKSDNYCVERHVKTRSKFILLNLESEKIIPFTRVFSQLTLVETGHYASKTLNPSTMNMSVCSKDPSQMGV